MAYMRNCGSYVYSDSEHVHFRGVIGNASLDAQLLDEFVVLRFLRLLDNDKLTVEFLNEIYEKHAGNFGVDGLARLLGHPMTMEWVESELEKKAKASETDGAT